MKNLGAFATINPESVSGDYPHAEIEYVDIAGVGTGVLERTRHLPLADAPSRARRVVRSGDTLLATVRPNLRSFWFARAPAPNMVASTGFAVLRANDGLDERFLYYVVSDHAFTDYLTANVKGAAYPAVDAQTIARAEVSVPPLPRQRKIAAILSAYDDLIENGLRRIDILEEMARNLYREWFVEFRFPGHERVRFVDSPLGRIPEGWELGKLGDVLQLSYGRALKKADRHPGTVPVYGSSGVVGRHDGALVAGPGVIVGRKGNVGSVFWSPADYWPIDTVYYVTSAQLPLRYLYFDLQEKSFINSDAAVPGLSRQQALALEMAWPPVGVAEDFCSLVEPLLALSESLTERNAALRQARDFLLPKLISGELDVSELPVRTRPLFQGDPQRLTGYRFFRDIAALPFVEKIVLFGSRARGDHEERSDIDLCVFCGDAGEDEWLEVLACLERDRVDTLLKVDCARFETSDAALRENVLTEGIVLFERGKGP